MGKLDVDLNEIREYCLESGFIELPITSEHAMAVKDLEHHHKDPFDRLIVATAISEPIKLLTADPQVAQYSSLAMLVQAGFVSGKTERCAHAGYAFTLVKTSVSAPNLPGEKTNRQIS